MGWKLDDNSRSAIHYLVLGVLVVGLPSLVIGLVDLSQTVVITADVHKLQVFRNGYLLDSPIEITATNASRGERLAFGALFSFLFGFVCAGLSWLLMTRKAHWRIGRWAGLVVLGYTSFAALRIPAIKSTVLPNELLVERYSVLPLFEIPVPLTKTSEKLETGPNGVVVERQAEPGKPWMVAFRTDEHAKDVHIASTVVDGPAYHVAYAYLSDIILHP